MNLFNLFKKPKPKKRYRAFVGYVQQFLTVPELAVAIISKANELGLRGIAITVLTKTYDEDASSDAIYFEGEDQ